MTPNSGGLATSAPEADATRDLYERYARQIFTYCLHQLGNKEEAEDATQSTFLNAFRGLKRGVDPEFETAWLYKIAQNVCLTRQRSSSRRRRVETPGDLDAIQDFVPAHQVDPDELIELPEALVAMPEQQRRALLMREWQGLSYKEIGDELGLSQAAVETLLFRARRSLAAGLEEDHSKRGISKRLRAGGDAGSLVALLKSFLLTGGAKVAATVATVAATSVVAATPVARHAVEHAVAPVPQHAKPKPHLVVPRTAAVATSASAFSSVAAATHQVVRVSRAHHAKAAHARRAAHAAPTNVLNVSHVPRTPESVAPAAPVASTPAVVDTTPALVPPAVPDDAPLAAPPPPAASTPAASTPAPAPAAVSPGQAKKDDPPAAQPTRTPQSQPAVGNASGEQQKGHGKDKRSADEAPAGFVPPGQAKKNAAAVVAAVTPAPAPPITAVPTATVADQLPLPPAPVATAPAVTPTVTTVTTTAAPTPAPPTPDPASGNGKDRSGHGDRGNGQGHRK